MTINSWNTFVFRSGWHVYFPMEAAIFVWRGGKGVCRIIIYICIYIYIAVLDLRALYWLGIIYAYRNMFIACTYIRPLNLIFFDVSSRFLVCMVSRARVIWNFTSRGLTPTAFPAIPRPLPVNVLEGLAVNIDSFENNFFSVILPHKTLTFTPLCVVLFATQCWMSAACIAFRSNN